MIDGWQPSIAGGTAFGWLTVVAYLAVALLCWRDARLAAVPARPGPTAFLRARAAHRVWLVVGAVMLALAINKLVDLQALLTAIGRAQARDQGWYGARRGLQRESIAATLAIGAALAVVAGFLARRAGHRAIAALVVTLGLTVFVVIRAASLHGVDALIGRGWGPVTINRCVEIGGIGLVGVLALAGWGDLRRQRDA